MFKLKVHSGCLALWMMLSTITLTTAEETREILSFHDEQLFDTLTESFFRSVPTQQRQQILSLHLDDNDIVDVASTTFNTFPKLSVLTLRNNMLTTFVAKADALQYLDLYFNSISDHNGTIVLSHPRLLSLNLANNSLSNVNWHLGNAPLTTLNLSGNFALHEVRIAAENLEELSLAGLDLQRLELDTGLLKELDVTGTRFNGTAALGEDLMRSVCLMNTRQDFRISYFDAVKGEEVYFNCFEIDMPNFPPGLESRALETSQTQTQPKKSINCHLSTLHINVDDVVFTAEQFLRVQLSFFALILMIVALIIANVVCVYYFILKSSRCSM